MCRSARPLPLALLLLGGLAAPAPATPPARPAFTDPANGKKVKNARITVRHNGAVIHDDLELTRPTPGGPLYLQNHGNLVRFRSLWVVPQP